MLASGALICSLNVAGCVHSPVYPEHWAPLTEIKTTEALPFTEFKMFKGSWCGAGSNAYLTGSYQDRGEIVTKQEGGTADVSLARLIFTKRELANIDPVEYVTIRGPENRVLEISAWNHDKLIITKQFRERTISDGGRTPDLFFCFPNGGIIINALMEGGASFFGAGGGSTETFLYKANDGALIGKHEDSLVGFIVVVPIYKYDRQWYRFEPHR